MALVTIAHLRRLGYCAAGLREWCKCHGYSLRQFSEGVPSEEIRRTGDGFAIKAADLAERESNGLR